jgi:hypothetical protein
MSDLTQGGDIARGKSLLVVFFPDGKCIIRGVLVTVSGTYPLGYQGGLREPHLDCMSLMLSECVVSLAWRGIRGGFHTPLL